MRDYDDNSKITHKYMAYVPDCIMVIFHGYTYAEGHSVCQTREANLFNDIPVW